MLKRQKITFLLYPLAVAVVAVLSLLPRLPKPPVPWEFWDKLEHFAVYLVLSVLGMLFFRPLISGRLTRFLVSAGVTIAFGGLLELVQPLTGRTTDLGDVIMNTAGVLTGGLAVCAVEYYLRRRENDRRGNLSHNEKHIRY